MALAILLPPASTANFDNSTETIPAREDTGKSCRQLVQPELSLSIHTLSVKRRRQLTFFLILSLCIGLPLLAWILVVQKRESPYPFKLSDRLAWLEISATAEDNDTRISFTAHDGKLETYSAEQFIEQVAAAQGQSGSLPPLFFRRLFNLTSWTGVFWVCIGLLGQILFTGRMLLQWLASEKQQRSIVPVSFWWLSLAGASMLIIYFTWRVDAVGILGQSTGWFIYIRNLWLIYSREECETEELS